MPALTFVSAVNASIFKFSNISQNRLSFSNQRPVFQHILNRPILVNLVVPHHLLYNLIKFQFKILFYSSRILYLTFLFAPYFLRSSLKSLPQTLQSAGPLWIKMGQWASTRRDILPDTLCDYLSSLQSNTRPHSFEKTRLTIMREFGESFFDSIQFEDQNPIGSGAVGQVYLATQTSNRKKLAVKVLHPDVESAIEVDLSIMKAFAAVLNYLPSFRYLSLDEEVAVFSNMMRQQLDLSIEASNLSRFRNNFSNSLDVKFPTPLFSSKSVLVEEYRTGVPLDTFLKNGPTPFDQSIAKSGLNAFMVRFL